MFQGSLVAYLVLCSLDFDVESYLYFECWNHYHRLVCLVLGIALLGAESPLSCFSVKVCLVSCFVE
jgi:hypothetical protein